MSDLRLPQHGEVIGEERALRLARLGSCEAEVNRALISRAAAVKRAMKIPRAVGRRTFVVHDEHGFVPVTLTLAEGEMRRGKPTQELFV